MLTSKERVIRTSSEVQTGTDARADAVRLLSLLCVAYFTTVISESCMENEVHASSIYLCRR